MSQSNDSNQTSTGANVLAEVADALKGSTGEVRTRLVRALTERELVKRVDLLDKALVKRGQLQNELNGIRPPGKKNFALDATGNMVEVQAVYTPEEVKKHKEELKVYTKKLKEATEKLAKFDKALEAAFGAGPDGSEKLTEAFAKLTKQVAGGGDSGGEDSEKSEE
jgi:hypothetical protein